MTITEFLGRLEGVDKQAKGWLAFCPSHPDRKKRSLSVSAKSDAILLHCFVGCTPEAIVGALRLNMRDLFLNGASAPPARRIVATYDYHDEQGVLLYEVVRFEPKDFRPRLPDGAWGLGAARRVLYRLSTLAGQPTIYVVEGEKDADALADVGLAATTSPGGASAWRSDYADQLRALTPTQVVVLPDNDPAGEGYATAVTAALVALKVPVRVVRLPNLAPKGDVSDWLTAGGTREALEALVQDTPLVTVSPVTVPEEPALRALGDDLWVAWPSRGLTMEFSRIVEHRDTLSAEVSVASEAQGELHWARLNLAATQTRATLARALEEAAPTHPWRELVEQACRLVAKHLRAGEPAVALVPELKTEARWFVPGWIPLNQLSVLCGDGGTGKSLFALALALAGLTGQAPSPSWRAAAIARVLYLDWEADRAEQQTRLWGLVNGTERPADGAIVHRTMRRPLRDEIGPVRAECARLGVDFVIADSLGPACGPEPESADAAIVTLSALRSLGVTTLCIAHVSKQAADAKGPSRPFGSVYVSNLARSVIEARRSDAGLDNQDEMTLSLYHRKSNQGRLCSPTAFTFSFGFDGRLTLRSGEPDLSRALLSTQVLDALRAGSKTASEIAEELDATSGSVKKALQRLETRDRVVRLVPGDRGKKQETQWGRRDDTRDRLGE